MKKILSLILFFMPFSSFSGKCDYEWQSDSAGRRCGGRAASVRPGGRLGGDGRYTDSYGRQRVYGRGNDPYDRDSYLIKTERKNKYKDYYLQGL